jgi:2-dehydro-3-deoxy-D-arabinonate dehydratase
MTNNNLLLFQTALGPIAQRGDHCIAIERDWNDLVNDDSLHTWLNAQCDSLQHDESLATAIRQPLAPIGNQEVWAAGVTYSRSRTARMEESQQAGGGDFYDRVYDAERPEIFFKATADRVVGPNEPMHLRSDSTWIVPEPELVLLLTRRGTIIGYTVGNDLSCRDIEGENPLYLPQAKTFDRCAALGPGILVTDQALHPDTSIKLNIRRGTENISADATSIGQMKRTLHELVGFLFRDNSHQNGCFLMTGTGIVPDDNVTLMRGDVVEISIDGIGTLTNTMD